MACWTELEPHWRTTDTFLPPARWVTSSWGPWLRPDAVMVDLGAGAGRHALAWARAGGRCVAVEVSPTAAGLLAMRSRSLSPPIDVQHADLLEVAADDLPRADLVLLADVLRMLDSEGRDHVLALGRSIVRPGGALLVGDGTQEVDDAAARLGDHLQVERLSARHLVARAMY